MRPTWKLLPALVALTLSASPALSQIAAYDDLDAPEGSLHAVQTGVNFTAWDVQNGNTTSYSVDAPGLGYQNLVVSGNAAAGGGAYLSSGVGLTIPAPWETPNDLVPYRYEPSYHQYALGADGATLWASMLTSQWRDGDQYTVSLHDGSIRWAEGDRAVRIGLQDNVWTLGQKDGATVSTGVERIPGQNYLMVLKMEFTDATTDRVTLYVNPTPGAGQPDVAGTVLDTDGDFYFRSMRFSPGNGRYDGFVDEVRLGGSYGDVTPTGQTWAQAPEDPFRVFYIGNSVTDTIQYDALREMAVGRGHVQVPGRQMIPGSPLDNLWNNPGSGFTTSPYGGYDTAFANYEWDAISLQPFDRQLPSDLATCTNFIDLARENSPDTQVYIYSRWPRKDSDGTLDYATKWLREYTGDYGTEESQDYFEQLVQALREEYPESDKPVLMVPCGDVLLELNERMHAGLVPGFTDIGEVYADGIHFNEVGQYIVGCTYFATLHRESPLGLPYELYGIADADLAAEIQDAVWDIVSVHPLAGVRLPGDANGDGAVTDADYTVWADHYGQTDADVWMGDFNGDGAVTDADYTIWADNYGEALAAVPEPASGALLLVALVPALRRRR
jgi:hypothetical protein